MSNSKAITPLIPAAFISGTLLLCAFACHSTRAFVTNAEADEQTVSEDEAEEPQGSLLGCPKAQSTSIRCEERSHSSCPN